MEDVSLNKAKVDEALNILASLNSDLDTLSNNLINASKRIINSKGFQEYVGYFSTSSVEPYISSIQDVKNELTTSILNKEIAILDFCGDTNGVMNIFDSVSPEILILKNMVMLV